MHLTASQRESIENIIRGAMLPVATGGFDAIEVHAPAAARAIAAVTEREGDSA
jgi:hypothetical protein